MRLFKLVLHNFRQYGHREIIKFPQDGLIGVLGKNGAGKSTLFNALGWCFYGKIKDVNKDMIINVSADKKEECYVEVFFEFQGVKYHAKRDMKKTNECFVKTADGTPYAIGTSNLSSYVEENLFKMDYNAFCSCYYAEQDDFDNLVKLTPAKRVQTVSKLLRIDDIDKASENTRREYRTLKSEVDEARKHLKNEDELKADKQKINDQIFSLRSQSGQIEKEIESFDAEYKNVLVQKAEGEKDYQTYRDLVNNLSSSKDKIETLKNRSLTPSENELNKLIELKKRYDEIEKYKQVFHLLKKQKEDMANARADFREKMNLEKDLASLEKEVQGYVSEYNKLKDEVAVFGETEKEVAEKESESTLLQEEIQMHKTSYQEKTFELKSKMEKINELKAMKTKFDELGTDSPCPTCERPLGEHYEDKMEHIKEEVNHIVSEAKNIQSDMKNIEGIMKTKGEEFTRLGQTLAKLRDDNLKKNTLSERMKGVQNELSIRKERYENTKTSYEKVKDVHFDEAKFADISDKLEKATKLYEEILRIENMIQKIPELENAIEEVKAEIENLEALIKKMEAEKESLAFDEKSYKEIDDKVKQLQDTLQQKKDEKTKIAFTIQGLEKDITFIDEKLLENEKLSLEIGVKQEEMLYLGKLDDAYKQYKSDILSKLAPTLSEIMSEDIEVMTNGKYNQIELDDEYNIYIYRDGKKHPLSFYSGGEKKLAALCQRLAISGLLVNQTGQASFDMLAMDEVFGSMDNERQDNVIDMLRNLNEKFPQILMVTHSENVKESFDHVLEIKQDNNGNSTFNWLTEWDVSDVDELLSEYQDIVEVS